MKAYSPETIYAAYKLYMTENYPSLEPIPWVDILRYYDANNKIECIKALRVGALRALTCGYSDTVARYLEKHLRVTGQLQDTPVLGLKEAKDWTDAIWDALVDND